MRISTGQIYAKGLGAMLEQQARLAKTQEQVATGKKLLSPADDPVGSVRAQELTRALERTGQYQRNANVLDNRLRLEEGVLGNSVEVLQRIRDLAVQGANATQDNESRKAIANEVWQQLNSLVGYANTRDSSGNFIFAGFKEGSQPFSYANGSVTYNGDDGVRQLEIGPAAAIADGDPGSAIFMNIPSGNGRFQVLPSAANQGDLIAEGGSVSDPSQFTGAGLRIEFTAPDQYQVVDSGGGVVAAGNYQRGDSITVAGMTVNLTGRPAAGDSIELAPARVKDVFATVAEFATALDTSRSSAADRATLTNQINAVISNLDQAISHLVDKQAGVGARMQSLESQMDINAGAEIRLQESLADITELDYAEGISRMNQQLLGLQAAQQAFAKVQGLSLFNYL
ncbi:flagellar hook-associated protein FlgL [Spongiibacter taiwanensis]|uniref:flagellar hook-associated protein FlgL n=1 Tax=Spongiibacter taiwanensis TaxID=1748242 RepID=UPI0020360EE2|nr:flagellar hook-associated protein FlgL [Spongiibacter taiwanensis]USA43776.1 flagellar hook-associated protein FlgL [Spongiibacter taiwanensis]